MVSVSWTFRSVALLTLALAGCRASLPVRPAASPERQLPTRQPSSATLQTAGSTLDATIPPPIALASHDDAAHVSALPDSQAVLTLADLEGIALENNPSLSAAAARRDAALGKRFQAGRYPNPSIGYHATEIGNFDTAGQQGGFVSQRFITADKLKFDQAIAGKEVDARHFQFHAQEKRVLNDVRVRFYDVLVAQRRVKLTTELAGIGDALVEATDKLLKGRLSTENDLLQAQIKADESHILLDNARNQSTAAWRRLAAVIGQPDRAETQLTGDLNQGLPTLDWESAYATVLENNPELNAARARADRACLAIHRARREPIPNVDLFVSGRHHNVTGYDVANVQLGIPLPIFDKNRGNIHAAEADWVASSNEVKRIELSLQDRLAVAFRRFENARQQTERYSRRMVPRAERSLKLVTDGYEKGQIEYLMLLTSQQTFLQVNLAYLDSLQELWTASAVIEGQLLTGSLNIAN